MTAMKTAFDNASTLTVPTLSTDSTTTTKESTMTIEQQIRNVKAYELKPELTRIKTNAKRRGDTDVWKTADTWLSVILTDISELNLGILESFVKENSRKPKQAKASKPVSKPKKKATKATKPKASKPKQAKASKPVAKVAKDTKATYKADAVSKLAKALDTRYSNVQKVLRALFRGDSLAKGLELGKISREQWDSVNTVDAKTYYFAKRYIK